MVVVVRTFSFAKFQVLTDFVKFQSKIKIFPVFLITFQAFINIEQELTKFNVFHNPRLLWEP